MKPTVIPSTEDRHYYHGTRLRHPPGDASIRQTRLTGRSRPLDFTMRKCQFKRSCRLSGLNLFCYMTHVRSPASPGRKSRRSCCTDATRPPRHQYRPPIVAPCGGGLIPRQPGLVRRRPRPSLFVLNAIMADASKFLHIGGQGRDGGDPGLCFQIQREREVKTERKSWARVEKQE